MEVWVEKYRPTDLFDVVGNGPVMERLRGMAAQGHMPNLILSGPPGCGKTTSVMCLARALLGDYMKTGVLELNASDDRGIDVVRDRIKNFAHQKVTLPPGRHKLIVLDEADSMTEAAQQALRRTMELCSATTRFALACNQSSKLIEPIQSRCAILRFGKLGDSEILSRLNQVVQLEQVPATDSGLEALVFTAEGDMRNALNNMQSAFVGFNTVSRETVLKVCDTPQPHDLANALNACIAANWNLGYDTLESLYNKGYSVGDIIGAFLRVLKNFEMREDLKIEFTKQVAVTHLRVVSDGVQTINQIGGMVARLCQSAQEMTSVRAGDMDGTFVDQTVRNQVLKIFNYSIKTPNSIKRQITCPNITDCTDVGCELQHFTQITNQYTQPELGLCSYLDLCRNEKCKFIHFEKDDLLPSREMLSNSSWINCDIRTFPLSEIFSNLVRAVLIDPPWDIHMDLSFGTLTDSEMLALDVGGIHPEGGFVFLWATNRTLELSRRCVRSWGYEPVDDIVWVKTNQIGSTVCSGRTGHWLNHAKEHCIVGVKGNVSWARFGHHRTHSDVIVAPVRENSKKPIEIYEIIESIVNRDNETICLELFGRQHNKRNGWITLGNQLDNSYITHPQIARRLEHRNQNI